MGAKTDGATGSHTWVVTGSEQPGSFWLGAQRVSRVHAESSTFHAPDTALMCIERTQLVKAETGQEPWHEREAYVLDVARRGPYTYHITLY